MSTADLRSKAWELSYRSSSVRSDGRPVDVLHDFYLPALRRATSYDRVAGYFRSSSLAAASQGFTVFVGRGGRMRMIVGADLEPKDVAAILAGEEARLSDQLNERLTSPERWPVAELRGVQLLGAMVASGNLEVKVALRVHGQTGQPLGWDSTEDGYVHEKWFLLGDDLGNKIYGAGSLNESRTALVLNAENIDLHCDWWGTIDSKRVVQAAADFQAIWNNERPHLRVMPLPDAVRQKLVRFAESANFLQEIDGTKGSEPLKATHEVMSAQERLQWALLQDGPHLPGGRWVGLATAPVEPWPHQNVVVRRMVANWPYSYLLCDEVGLGKTIEAGLAFRCLYLSGLAPRILVAAPASLTKQWWQQMAEKVLLPFALLEGSPVQKHSYLLPEERENREDNPFAPDLLIVSTGLLERQERQRQFRAATPFDIALVDEAHNARRSNSAKGFSVAPDYNILYRFVSDTLRPNCKALFLATATPLQLHAVEVYDLLRLTRRAGAYLEDPTLLATYYQLVDRLRQGASLEDVEWQFLLQNVRHVQRQDPALWHYIEMSILQSRQARNALDNWLGYAEHTTKPSRTHHKELGRILTQTAPLARVMLRHSRSLLRVYSERGKLTHRLASRRVVPKFVSFSEGEEEVYKELEQYCRELQKVLALANKDSRRNTLMFYLSFLRQRFASSLYAIEKTLERRLERVQLTLKQLLEHQARVSVDDQIEAPDWDSDDDETVTASLLKDRTVRDLRWEEERVQSLLSKLKGLSGQPSKIREFFELLGQRRLPNQPERIRQLVVFTRYFDTLKHLKEQLQQTDSRLRVGVYSGTELGYYDAARRIWVSSSREGVKQRFLQQEIDVLLCTDAAAEGLNLQTAETLVNFDMGWNPMKLEQRIGRIDRIGQQHAEVYIHNYCYQDSVEQLVYNRLLSRLNEAGLIVGEQQVSLLPITPEDFARLAQGEISEEELWREAEKRLQAQRASAAALELGPEEIYELYERLNRTWTQEPAPVELADIERLFTQSEWLENQGAHSETVRISDTEECLTFHCPVLTLDNSADAGPMLFTWHRELYDLGLSESKTRLSFGSYGEPVFDRLVKQASQSDLPQCFKRLSVEIPALPDREQVGYAVAVRKACGYEVRLVTSLREAWDLDLAEEVELSTEQVKEAQTRLRLLMLKETQLLVSVERIEKQNLAAGAAQTIFNLEIGAGLLEDEDKFDSYGSAMRELEKFFEGHPGRFIPNLPLNNIHVVTNQLLIQPNISSVLDHASYTAPRLVAKSALDAVSRRLHEADRRSLLREQAIRRLKSTINELVRRYERMY